MGHGFKAEISSLKPWVTVSRQKFPLRNRESWFRGTVFHGFSPFWRGNFCLETMTHGSDEEISASKPWLTVSMRKFLPQNHDSRFRRSFSNLRCDVEFTNSKNQQFGRFGPNNCFIPNNFLPIVWILIRGTFYVSVSLSNLQSGHPWLGFYTFCKYQMMRWQSMYKFGDLSRFHKRNNLAKYIKLFLSL